MKKAALCNSLNAAGFVRPALLATVAMFGMLGQAPAQTSIFSIIPSPSPNGRGNTLNAVTAVSSDDGWAVGFRNDNQLNGARTLTEHWDGSAWTVVPSPNPGSTPACRGQNTGNVLSAVAAVSRSSVWAVGFSFECSGMQKPMILHFNGSAWQAVPSPALLNSNAVLNGIAVVAPNNIYAAGFQPAANGAVLTLIEHFDGHAWSVMPSPNANHTGNVLTSISARAANDIWAVGDLVAPNTPVQTLALHFNGTAWSVVPTPSPVSGSGLDQNVLTSVRAASAKDVTAVGFTLDFNTQQRLTLVEHWDGAVWTVIPSPNPGTGAGVLNTLTAVSGSAGDLYAVGFFANAATAGQPQTLVEHFDGAVWNIVASPTRDQAQQLNGVYSLPNSTNVWAVGASAPFGVQVETGLLQVPLTLVLFTPVG
ncbi:MAG: hypothetical protein U0Q18_28665 [Bryobacteraceae bacterium]